MTCREITVENLDKPLRADVYLSACDLKLSRSQIHKLADEGHISLNDISIKAAHKVQQGDRLKIEIPEAKSLEAQAENIPLEILYEDEDLAVVNKPQHLVVHAAAGHDSGTLVNALLFHLKNLSSIGGVLRPGIVHRLDKGTSGLMVVAKSNEAHQHLVRQFQERTVQKTYLALCYGHFKQREGKIESKLGRSTHNRKKISSKTKQGKEAKTLFKVLEQSAAMSFVEVKILTGRTHQIRAHFSEQGHPLVGDPLYGGKQWLSKLDETLRQKVGALDHQLLHAHQLKFTHPRQGRTLSFETEVPEDFRQVLIFSNFQNYFLTPHTNEPNLRSQPTLGWSALPE
ncbi:MAG: RluA family pseudouridine synthase [Deltaproteobacteria bacterium]|nr:RluA family pseudouridine synthase [Deltaproteobacteria bacterium]